MFIDKTIACGLLIGVLGVALAVAAFIYAILNVSVPQVVRLAALSASPGSVILQDAGDSVQLTVRGYYSDLSRERLDEDSVDYTSTNPSVATVSESGVVTAMSGGSADVIVERAGLSERVHVIVFGEIPTIPPIDPDMAGVIPNTDILAVLNRVIVELTPGYGDPAAGDIANGLNGEVIFTYRSFPGYLIEFDMLSHPIEETLQTLESDSRVDIAYPDLLMETADHPIDSLIKPSRGNNLAYTKPGFESAWRIMETVPDLNPVIISVVEIGDSPLDHDEFDRDRIHRVDQNIGQCGSDHVDPVTGVIAAINHGGKKTDSRGNRIDSPSGIVASVGELDYEVINITHNQKWCAIGLDIPGIIESDFMSLSDTLANLDTTVVNEYDIDVVNMSFSGGYTGETQYSQRFTELVQEMDWITFVPAAGNQNRDASLRFPARMSRELENVITAGGANSSYNNRAGFSNYGDAVTIAAPAEKVWTVNEQGTPVWVPGTSFAAPIVSGTVALLKSINPELAPAEFKKILIDSADVKPICEERLNLTNCPDSKKEDWPFLRADRAVVNLLLDHGLVSADVGETLTVPTDHRNDEGNFYRFGVPIKNTGRILWNFYAEAEVTSPDGNTINLSDEKGRKFAIAPGKSHLFKWGFLPPRSSCYDLKITVSVDEPNSPLWDHLWSTFDNFDANVDGVLDIYERGVLTNYYANDRDSFLWNHLRFGFNEYDTNVDGVLDIHEINALISVEFDDRMTLAEVEMEGALDVLPDSRVGGSSCPDARGVPLGVRSAGRADAIILSDTSGSMDGAKIESLRASIIGFVQEIYRMKDSERNLTHIGLTEFNSDIRPIIAPAPIGDCEICVSYADWENRANSLAADGGTALYDSIAQSVAALENQNSDGLPRSNSLIVLTDGEDTRSGMSLGELKTLLGESSVTLFIVAYGDYERAPDALRELAEAGRGAAYTADESSLQELYALFSSMF